MKLLLQETLRSLVDAKTKLNLIDLRPEHFYECGHIAGACNICVHEIDFVKKAGERFARRDEPIFVYGPTGTALEAQKGIDLLTQAGFTDVQALSGGYSEWHGADGANSAANANVQDNFVPSNISGKFELDLATSRLQWIGKNISNNHTGRIKFVSGQLEIKNSQLVGANLVADMNSLTDEDLTDGALNQMLVNHLKSADFLAVAEFPTATAKLSDARLLTNPADGESNCELNFSLEVRGKTLPARAMATLYLNPAVVNLQGSLRVDRTIFGSLYGSKKFFKSLANHVVNDLVDIYFTLNANLKV